MTETEMPKRRPGRPRQTERTREYQERLDDVVETAARVFREKGYDKGSLDDVAAALDLRKASLYHYVPSKAHLLYLIFDRAITDALDRLKQLEEVEPAERLASLIRHQVNEVASQPDFFAVFFDHRPRLEPDYDEKIRVKERTYIKVFQDAVEDAVEAGVLPPVDGRHGAQAILGMCSWVYKWLDPRSGRTDEVARDFIAMLLPVGSARRVADERRAGA